MSAFVSCARVFVCPHPSTGRVAPDRRWFGNTRVIKQEELDKFREEMSTR